MPVTRAAALLFGICLAFPALSGPRHDSACGFMRMPPAELHDISRGFGNGHPGIDLVAPLGSPIRAAASGTIVSAGWYSDYGKMVDIRHADGLITRYGHLSAFAPGIVPGALVPKGTVIGRVGMTGLANGPHLHFEVRTEGHAVDPKPYLALAPCRRPAFELLEEAWAPYDGRHNR